MDGIGWEWIVGAIAVVLITFVAGRLSGGGGEQRTDLSGTPVGPTMRGATPPPASAPAPLAARMLDGVPPDQRQAIAAALTSGNKIQAIKLLREATGLGLRESKDTIEAIESQGKRG